MSTNFEKFTEAIKASQLLDDNEKDLLLAKTNDFSESQIEELLNLLENSSTKATQIEDDFNAQATNLNKSNKEQNNQILKKFLKAQEQTESKEEEKTLNKLMKEADA